MLKQPPTEARIASDIERILAERLPPTWTVESLAGVKPAEIDLTIKVGAQPALTATLAVEIKRTIDPRLIDEAAELREIRRAELALNVPAEEARVDEFMCSSCFLVKRTSQLANKRKLICRDCE